MVQFPKLEWSTGGENEPCVYGSFSTTFYEDLENTYLEDMAIEIGLEVDTLYGTSTFRISLVSNSYNVEEQDHCVFPLSRDKDDIENAMTQAKRMLRLVQHCLLH